MSSKEVSKKSSETHLDKARKGSASLIEISSLHHSYMSEVLLNQDSYYSWLSNQNWASRTYVGGHTNSRIVKYSQAWGEFCAALSWLCRPGDFTWYKFALFCNGLCLGSPHEVLSADWWLLCSEGSILEIVKKCKRVWTHWRWSCCIIMLKTKKVRMDSRKQSIYFLVV